MVHGVIEGGELQGDRVEVRHSDEYVSVNDERVADAQEVGLRRRDRLTRCSQRASTPPSGVLGS